MAARSAREVRVRVTARLYSAGPRRSLTGSLAAAAAILLEDWLGRR